MKTNPAKISLSYTDSEDLSKVAYQTFQSLNELSEHLGFIQAEFSNEDRFGAQTILVDFDVIRMFAEFRFSRSIYAKSIALAFQNAQKGNIAFVVSQGARMELVYYIASTIMRKRRLLHTNMQEDVETVEGLYKDPSFNRERDRLLRSRHFSEIASMLDDFSRKYSRSLALLKDGAFTEKSMADLRITDEYSKALKEINAIRRYAPRRNDADAANLAILDLANKRGLNYRLVSGTRILNEIRPRLVFDPITLLIRLHPSLNKDVSLSGKIENLQHIRQRVIELRNEIRKLFRATKFHAKKTKRFLTQKRVTNWLTYLEGLKNDEIIGDIINLISAVQVDAESRIALLEKPFIDDCVLPPAKRVMSIQRDTSKMSSLIPLLYGNESPLEDLGCRWTAEEHIGGAVVQSIVNSKERAIFTMSIFNSYFAVSWPTSQNVSEFFSFIHKGLNSGKIERGKHSVIKLYYNERPTRHIGLSEKGLPLFTKISRKMQPDGIRVICKELQFIYEAKPTLSLSFPEVTVIGNFKNTDIVLEYYDWSYLEYVPPPTFINRLKDYQQHRN